MSLPSLDFLFLQGFYLFLCQGIAKLEIHIRMRKLWPLEEWTSIEFVVIIIVIILSSIHHLFFILPSTHACIHPSIHLPIHSTTHNPLPPIFLPSFLYSFLPFFMKKNSCFGKESNYSPLLIEFSKVVASFYSCDRL